MNGLECHFIGRLGKDAESRTTRTNKPMTVLTVAVDTKDGDAATWCTVLAFEELAERLAGLIKGTGLYVRGKLKADLYTPQGGEPRVSLTLLASHVEPMVLERSKPPRPPQAHRKAVVYGAAEPLDDAL